jgi:hypothetical protein
MVLTISRAGTITIARTSSASAGPLSPAGNAKTVAAGTPAAGGLGMPTK